jgi:hypothetical protein
MKKTVLVMVLFGLLLKGYAQEKHDTVFVRSTFRTMLKEDENELQEAGINTEILPLLLDKIKYDMEEKHQKGIDTREKNGRTFSV